MIKISDKQKRVLEFVREYIRKNGIPPSAQEVNKHFNYRWEHAARRHINTLISKGYLERAVPHARSIRFPYLNKPRMPGFYILKQGENYEPVEVYQEGEELFVLRIRKFHPELVTEELGMWRML